MNTNDSLFDKFIAFIRGALRVVTIAVAVIGILILVRSVVNALFLYNYDRGSYQTIAEYTVDNIAVGENYVIPYNLGNAEYQRQNYEKAIPYYWEALSKKMPETEEECKVRVNLALSMCHTIDFDNLDVTDPDAVMQAISVLIEARYVLTEKGCASEPVGSFDGHYANADKLRNDIDEMLQYLSQYAPNEEGQGEGGGGGEDENDSDGGGGDDSQDQDQNQDQDKDQDQDGDGDDSQSSGSKERAEKEIEERARQEGLKEDLKQQKQDLKEQSESPRHNDYEYLDGGGAQGYGDGTLW